MAEAFKKSDIEILLSTMNRSSLDFLLPMFPFGHFSDYNILIINQTTADNILGSEYPSVRIINSFERGLSKSRNLAIAGASKRIGLIADDDVIFVEGFDQSIANGFNHFSNAAIIKFMATTFEGVPFRKYPKQPIAHLNALLRLTSSSIEMALNLEQVHNSETEFDIRFGLGTSFPLGEEPIFINELHARGFQISHYPEVIVTHKAFIDSDDIPLAENYRIRGAYLEKIFKNRFMLWLGIQLMYNLKSGIVKPWQIFYVLRHGLKGRREFLAKEKSCHI